MINKTSSRFLVAAVAVLAMTGIKAKAESWTDFLDFTGFTKNTKLESLLTISNDRGTDYNVLSGMVDDRNNLTGVDFANFTGGHSSGSKQYPANQIGTSNGVVLVNEQGVDALILRGKINGGEADLVVRFIFNGLSKEYHECKVTGVRGTDNVWHMKNAYTGKMVDKAKLITYSIGIKTIDGICP